MPEGTLGIAAPPLQELGAQRRHVPGRRWAAARRRHQRRLGLRGRGLPRARPGGGRGRPGAAAAGAAPAALPAAPAAAAAAAPLLAAPAAVAVAALAHGGLGLLLGVQLVTTSCQRGPALQGPKRGQRVRQSTCGHGSWHGRSRIGRGPRGGAGFGVVFRAVTRRVLPALPPALHAMAPATLCLAALAMGQLLKAWLLGGSGRCWSHLLRRIPGQSTAADSGGNACTRRRGAGWHPCRHRAAPRRDLTPGHCLTITHFSVPTRSRLHAGRHWRQSVGH